MTPSNSSKARTFSNIWSEFRHWLSYRFCFCKGVLLASGLVFSVKLIEYSISAILITYLANKELNNAAILAMIQEAVSALLEIVMVFISDALGHFLVISVSSLFSVIGLVLLYHGSKNSEKSRFDISGILLLAVGQARAQPLIQEFIVDQYRNHESDQGNPGEDRVIARKNVWCRIVWVFSVVATLLIYEYSDSWTRYFEISAWATGSSLILFLCGSTRFYHSGVLADTGRKQDEDSTPSLEERKIDRKKIKYFEKMGCMWSTFLLFGFVLSAGNIFFPYQGEFMEKEAFLPLLVVIQYISRKIISFLSGSIIKKVSDKSFEKKKAKLVRICIGMLLSIPCFVVAWRVDDLRLRSLANGIGLENNKIIFNSKKSIFYLVPQFCILGLMEGLAQDGLDEFMLEMFSESRRDYVSAINTFVIGLGTLGNVLFYKIANGLFIDVTKELGTKEALREKYTTRLGKYFIIVTIVGSVNLCYYLGISLLFYYKSKKNGGENNKKNGAEKDKKTADLELNTVEKDESSQTADLELNTAEGVMRCHNQPV